MCTWFAVRLKKSQRKMDKAHRRQEEVKLKNHEKLLAITYLEAKAPVAEAEEVQEKYRNMNKKEGKERRRKEVCTNLHSEKKILSAGSPGLYTLLPENYASCTI